MRKINFEVSVRKVIGSIFLCAFVATTLAAWAQTPPSSSSDVAPVKETPTPESAPAPVETKPAEATVAPAQPETTQKDEPAPADQVSAPVEATPAPAPTPVVDVSKIFLIPKVGPSEVVGLEWLPNVVPIFDQAGEAGGQIEAVILIGKFNAVGSKLLFGDHVPVQVNPDNSFSIQLLLTSERTTNFLSAVDASGNVQRQFFMVEVPGWIPKGGLPLEDFTPRGSWSLSYDQLSIDQNDIPKVSQGVLSLSGRYNLIPNFKFGLVGEAEAKIDLVPVADSAAVGLKYYQLSGRWKKTGTPWAKERAQSTYSLGFVAAQSKVNDDRYGLNLYMGPELGISTVYKVKENWDVTGFVSFTPILSGTSIRLSDSLINVRIEVEPKVLYRIRRPVFTLLYERMNFASSSGADYIKQGRISLGIGKRF